MPPRRRLSTVFFVHSRFQAAAHLAQRLDQMARMVWLSSLQGDSRGMRRFSLDSNQERMKYRQKAMAAVWSRVVTSQ